MGADLEGGSDGEKIRCRHWPGMIGALEHRHIVVSTAGRHEGVSVHCEGVKPREGIGGPLQPYNHGAFEHVSSVMGLYQ